MIRLSYVFLANQPTFLLPYTCRQNFISGIIPTLSKKMNTPPGSLAIFQQQFFHQGKTGIFSVVLFSINTLLHAQQAVWSIYATLFHMIRPAFEHFIPSLFATQHFVNHQVTSFHEHIQHLCAAY